MSKDWTIVGKGITCKDAALTLYPGFSVYPDFIIEILRKELIEEIEGKEIRDIWNNPHNNLTVLKEKMIEIVNKKFGVKE